MEQFLSGIMVGREGCPFIAYTLFCICVVVNVIKYTHQLFVLLMLYVKETVLSFIWDCCNYSTPLSLLPLAPLCKLGESVDPECLLCTFSPPLCGPMGSFDKQTTFFSYLCCVSVVLHIVISWYLFGVFGRVGSVFVLFYFCSKPPPISLLSFVSEESRRWYYSCLCQLLLNTRNEGKYTILREKTC